MKSFTRYAAVSAALVGGLMSLDASAVNISTDQIGEVSIVPYYNARDDFQTIFSMINTRDVPMVVKVRVHEGRNSRDVLDFNVALSSFDVFSGAIRTEDVDGLNAPVLKVVDQSDEFGRKTCTIPAIIANQETPLSPLAFGPPAGGGFAGTDDDGGPTGDAPGVAPDVGLNAESALRMTEGYIEFIVMGYAEGDDQYPLGGTLDTVGDAIESHDCSTLDMAFAVPNIINTAQQFGEPISALKVNASLLNPVRGFETNIPVLTLANFYNPESGDWRGGSPVTTPPGEGGRMYGQVAPAIQPIDNINCTKDRGIERRDNGENWDPSGVDGSCRNLITAQDVPDFLEPTLNDAWPPVANYWDDSRNFAAYAGPLEMILCPTIDGDTPPAANACPGSGSEIYRGVDAVSLLLQRVAVFNEWTNNSDITTTTSDWILTLPTKGFYVDGGPDNTYAGNNNMGPGLQSAIVPGGAVTYTNSYVIDEQDGGRDETILGWNGLINPMPYHPFSNTFGQQTPSGAPRIGREYANSCNRIGVTVYDRAEQSAGDPPDGGVIPSPAPPPVIATLNLCYETNVISFDDTTILDSQYPLLNTDGSDTTVDTDGLVDGLGNDNDAGWMALRLDTDDGAYMRAAQLKYDFSYSEGTTRGLPVTGFLLRARTFGEVFRNNATSFEHSYNRYYDQPEAPACDQGVVCESILN